MVFNPRNVKGETQLPVSGRRYTNYVSGMVKEKEKLNGKITLGTLDKYLNYFYRFHVALGLLYDFFAEESAEMKLRRKMIEVSYKDERWRIIPVEKDEVILEHNNYLKGLSGARFYDEGYHTQKTTSMTKALKYIMKYDYMIIHNAEAVARENMKKALTDVLTSGFEAFFERKD